MPREMPTPSSGSRSNSVRKNTVSPPCPITLWPPLISWKKLLRIPTTAVSRGTGPITGSEFRWCCARYSPVTESMPQLGRGPIIELGTSNFQLVVLRPEPAPHPSELTTVRHQQAIRVLLSVPKQLEER